MSTTVNEQLIEEYGFYEHDLARSICEDSFFFFVKEFWDVLVPDEDLVCNWHIPFLCNELQRVAERVFRKLPKKYDLFINVPPGTTKSTIASIMFPAWVWTRMASARLICGSYSFDLAKDLSLKCRSIIRSEKYATYWPEVQFAEDQNTMMNFANTQKGMRLATSVGSSPTGRHGHFIIVDDPMDPGMALSELNTQEANNWMDMVIPSRMVNKTRTPIIVIMQRLHQDDCTGHRLEQKDGPPIRHICFPADATEGYPVIPEKCLENYADGLLDPVRLPRDMLQQERIRMGEFGYAGQYGQQPVPLGGALFLVDRLQVSPIAEEIVQKIRYWDKAVSLKKTACFTVGVKMELGKSGRIYVSDCIRGRWNSDDRENLIRSTAEMDGHDTIIGVEEEGGSGGPESALNTVRNLHGFNVQVHKEATNKVARAEPFSVQVNNGNVTLVPGDWNLIYRSEMQFFPYSTFLDQVDASSGAYNILSKPVRRAGGWK